MKASATLSKKTSLKHLELTARFVTPAFLGNAEQIAQWRTPPFKALLRQWWRIAAARDHGYDVARLREAEGRLFGAASDTSGSSQQSRVRLRLGSWNTGTLKGSWGDDPQVFHREVGNDGRRVGSHLYLGYGSLDYSRELRRTILKNGAAIQADESAPLRIWWSEDADSVATAIQLIHWFGCLGGRSCNGWGSLQLEGDAMIGDSFGPRNSRKCTGRPCPGLWPKGPKKVAGGPCRRRNSARQ